MMHGTTTMMGAFAGWMWIMPVALLALLAWIVWQLASGPTWSSEDRIHTEELLRERYAAGELDTDDFERRLASIRRHAS